MRDEDLLETCLFKERMAGKPTPRVAAHTRAALDRLSDLLDNATFKKADLWQSGISTWGLWALAPADLVRAHELCRRVIVQGGSGSTHVQEGLLEMIALAKSPSSAAFWLEMLDLSRPRDAFAQTRRTCALAALALIACRTDASAGLEALLKAAAHANPEVRAMAALYIGRACSESGGGLPTEAKAILMDIARNDAAFGPCYQARLALQAAGDSAPLDHPGEVFLFRVSLKGNPHAWRTIAVKSEQTLAHLHDGIQRAFDWDADHLYSFFLNGNLHDWRYSVACPYDEEATHSADEAIIGNLGLATKHKFVYFFDYGDCHEFDVQMVGVKAKVKQTQYPRVTESRGKAPEQYRW